MSEARERHEWALASAVMALIANIHRDPKRSRPLKPSDFDPFAQQRPVPKVPVTVLKDVFIHGQMPNPVKEIAT
jgi:hypothetical protein